jgi:hypothetical protein
VLDARLAVFAEIRKQPKTGIHRKLEDEILNNSPWKSDNWFVSPWNYLDEVKKDFVIPEKVKIHDVTLRDGEQQAGIIFSKDDKIRIAEKLAEVGVHRIEGGNAGRIPQGRGSPAGNRQTGSGFRDLLLLPLYGAGCATGGGLRRGRHCYRDSLQRASH